MVYVFTRFFLLTLYLLAHASSAVGKYCKDDHRSTGCWMCPESDLMACLNPHISKAEEAKTINDPKERAKAYCEAYARISQCWSEGLCCSEFSPSLAAAANVCNLATYPSSLISEDLLHKATTDAEKVRLKIWHNDRGTEVPKFHAYIKAYTGDSADSSSYHAQYTSKAKHDSPKTEDSSSKNDEYQYASKFHAENVKSTDDSISETKYSKTEDSAPKQESAEGNQKHKSDYHYKGSVHKKIHHKAYCSTKDNKCQSHVASQYHKARHESFAKREESQLVKRHTSHSASAHFWKRSKGQPKCGLDFQGVPYPTRIPDSVLKVFVQS